MNTLNFNSLIKDYVAFERSTKSNDKPYHFNLLDEQQGHIVENSHSNILVKLLQYNDGHGWVFLESFLSRLDISLPLNKDIVFKREHNRIDILIYSKSRFAIIIENKANRASSRTNQISDYIDQTLNDSEVFDNIKTKKLNRINKIWIIYLDRDGNTEPDKNSKTRLEKDFKDKYKAANYLMHILPWLEEDVLPVINYKDKELLAGVIQYIQYLKGNHFLGLNLKHNERIKERVEWLKQNLSSKLERDFYKKNKKLHQIYLKILRNKTNDSFTDSERTTLLNALSILNEEPMRIFFETTFSFFINCKLIHHFTFYYCYITPYKWTGQKIRISFGWETMGIRALTKSKKYTFGIVISGPEELRNDFEKKFNNELKKIGYNKNNNITRVLNYRAEIKTCQPLLDMDEDKLKRSLLSIYGKYASKELMSKIQRVYYSEE